MSTLSSAVDNIPLNEPVHPAVDLLAADFVAHRFDLQRLIRLIVRSRPFGLDSAADFEIKIQVAMFSLDIAEKLMKKNLSGDKAQKDLVESYIKDLKIN